MPTERKGTTLFWFLAIAAAAALTRLLWLADMEFKSDEVSTVQLIAEVGSKPWSALGPVSGNSRFAHSSGFFYFVHWLSGGSPAPLRMVKAIAAFNVFSILLPLVLLWRRPRFLMTCAMWATSVVLIYGSRKIWTPDLQAAWSCLAIGLLGAASRFENNRLLRRLLPGLAGFCLVLAGHMYMPSVFVAMLGGLVVLLVLAATRQKERATAWLIGSALGWMTFVPWLVAVIKGGAAVGHPGATSATFGLGYLSAALRLGFTVASPLHFYLLYLDPVLGWLWEARTTPALVVTLGLLAGSIGLWLSLTILAIWTSVLRRRELVRDPLLVTGVALLFGMPLAVYAVRLGSHLHYFFGAIPFLYYWIAWAVVDGADPGSRWRAVRVKLAAAACVVTLGAAISFAILVHENNGLPGEYGRSYRAGQWPSDHS